MLRSRPVWQVGGRHQAVPQQASRKWQTGNWQPQKFTDSTHVDYIYLDYSKSLDSINNRLLVVKLQGLYGIWSSHLRFLDSYLRDRSLIVKFDGATVKPFPVVSGVSQRFHLGPNLFNLFVNNIGTIIDSKFYCLLTTLKSSQGSDQGRTRNTYSL